MLFSWARAEVFSHRFDAPMLAPQWTQPKIGPLLRGEKDLRYYSGLFESRPYVRGLSRMLALYGRRKVDGASFGINVEPARLPASCEGALVFFRGYDGWFRDDLYPHRELVRRRLESILSDPVRQEIRSFDQKLQIAMHVRRGDMRREGMVAAGQALPTGNVNVVESEYYFRSLLRRIREDIGRCVPVTIFTDAHEGDLPELAAEEEVRFAGPRTAIADMLLMARAPVLIASSASSFSAWASYLGQAATVWGRGRVGCRFPDRPELAIESDPHGAIGDQGRELIAGRLAGATSEATP
jgi:hypothetical protein